jgi:hypothetical protein
MDEDLRAKIYAMPTREELRDMLAQFVTREVFNIELKQMRDIVKDMQDDIKLLQDKPENNKRTNREKIALIVSIAVAAIAIIGYIGYVSQHLAWR